MLTPIQCVALYSPLRTVFPQSAGALLAVTAAQQAAAPGVMCLRGVNPYVEAALTDWSRRSSGSAPLVPRAAAPAAALPMPDALAGEVGAFEFRRRLLYSVQAVQSILLRQS